MTVTTLLSGGVTDTTATVVAKVAGSSSCRLARSLSASLTSPTYTSPVSADGDGYVSFTVTGLTPNTRYYYGVEEAGVLGTPRGKFRTMPTATVATSFMIAHASCTSYYDVNPSNHRVYDSIRARDPLLFWMGGDEGYADIATADTAAMRSGLAASLGGTARAAALHADVPHVYVWDDHDFGPDNGNGTFVGKTNRAAVYRQLFPHYPLPDTGAVYQAFTIGRVRFIQTDNRYYRSPNTDTDNTSKSMLGATQKAWLKAELLAGKDFAMTVWLNSQVWCVPSSGWSGQDTDGDHWGAYSTERAEINNYMATNSITNVIQLTGDMHALGIRWSVDYSTAGTAPMRVYAAASLDAIPIGRNGGWEYMHTGRGQYGTLDVTDHGSSVDVVWQGWQTDPATGVDTLVMSDSFTLTQSAAPGAGGHPVKVWDGAAWVARPAMAYNGSTWLHHPVN
jgi:phosphodiesterase/alkaline phosphatase D-like protein